MFSNISFGYFSPLVTSFVPVFIFPIFSSIVKPYIYLECGSKNITLMGGGGAGASFSGLFLATSHTARKKKIQLPRIFICLGKLN